MVENTEDEKIREDSNEGLDSSSSSNVVVVVAFVAACRHGGAAFAVVVLLHCYRNSSFASKMATTAQLRMPKTGFLKLLLSLLRMI